MSNPNPTDRSRLLTQWDQEFGRMETREGVEATANLLAAIAQKDATIKALADALVKHARQVPCPNCGGVGSQTCATCDHGEKPTHHPEVIAALRLAGRL